MVQKEKRRGKEVLNGFKPVHIWMLSLAIINAYLGYNDKYPMILKKYKAIWKKTAGRWY